LKKLFPFLRKLILNKLDENQYNDGFILVWQLSELENSCR